MNYGEEDSAYKGYTKIPIAHFLSECIMKLDDH
jgi:hypothetical protein